MSNHIHFTILNLFQTPTIIVVKWHKLKHDMCLIVVTPLTYFLCVLKRHDREKSLKTLEYSKNYMFPFLLFPLRTKNTLHPLFTLEYFESSYYFIRFILVFIIVGLSPKLTWIVVFTKYNIKSLTHNFNVFVGYESWYRREKRVMSLFSKNKYRTNYRNVINRFVIELLIS